MERRFQPVTVAEPTAAQTRPILESLRDVYEEQHRVCISDEALYAAVDMAVRYIPDRFLPDKAIDLMDEAAAALRISRLTAPPDLKMLKDELSSIAREIVPRAATPAWAYSRLR